VKLWLLLRANRLLVAGVLTVAVFVAFVAVAVVLSPSLAEKVGASDPIETLFASMITAIVTGATLVVTIGQLVLTQENGPLGDQQDRMDGTLAVRESVADLTGAPTPTDPAAFLDAILGAAAERARDLRDSVSDQGGDGSDRDALRDDVDDLAAGVTENADAVRGQLDGAEFGSFDVVFAALNFDYGPKIGRIERIAAEHDEALTDDERDLLGELKESLSLFGPGREHVKTLYFQWALIDLSRLILYAAVPALLVAGLTLAAVDAGTFPGSTLGVDHVTLVVGGAFAVTLLPFSLFVSYLLRVLTLAKRTLAIGPLVLRDSE
jgi:ABC-type multidrug transport system fused ATPase/permease subunit